MDGGNLVTELLNEEGLLWQCPDFDDRLTNGEFPLDYETYEPYLNQKRADKFVEIMQRLRIPDIPGQPLMQGDEYFPLWIELTARIVGGGLQEDGTQLAKEILVSIGKKNGKTTNLVAPFAIASAMMSPRPNATGILMSRTKELAQTMFAAVAGIIRADPQLSKLFKIQNTTRVVTFVPNNFNLQVKSMDTGTVTGVKPVFVAIDETWLFDNEAAQSVMMQLRGAGAAISESQIVHISTHADHVPKGTWKGVLETAKKTRSGEHDIRGFVPLLWETPPSVVSQGIEAVCDPKNWHCGNPNLGRSVDLRWLKSSFKNVLAAGDDIQLRQWLSQHANCEITDQLTGNAEDTWIGAPIWNTHTDSRVDFEWVLENCNRVCMGFDGGGLTDITSLCVLGLGADGEWYVGWKHYVYPQFAANNRREGILSDAIRDGLIEVVQPGEEIQEIAAMVLDLTNQRGDAFFGLAIDPSRLADEMNTAAAELGVDQYIHGIKQGWGLQSGWITVERKLSTGKLVHGGRDFEQWCANNVRVKAGLPAKKYSADVGKIDPVIALFMAAILANNPPPEFDVSAMIGGTVGWS